jgi:hypothetical protein
MKEVRAKEFLLFKKSKKVRQIITGLMKVANIII